MKTRLDSKKNRQIIFQRTALASALALAIGSASLCHASLSDDVYTQEKAAFKYISSSATAILNTKSQDESLQILSGGSQIVFIDSAVSDYQTLVNGLAPGAEVYLLDGKKDGVQQMAKILSLYSNVQAVHIIAHGKEASVQLGNVTFDAYTLSNNYQREMQTIKASLAEGADMLVHSCNTGYGEAGREFVEELALVTGADIAASDDLTGNAQKGGDWELEISKGSIETEQPFSEVALRDFSQVLALPTNGTYTFSGFTDNGTNAGSTVSNAYFVVSAQDQYTGGSGPWNDRDIKIFSNSLLYQAQGSDGVATTNQNTTGAFTVTADGTNVGSFELTGLVAGDYTSGDIFSNVYIKGYKASDGTTVTSSVLADTGSTKYTFTFGAGELGAFSGIQLSSFKLFFFGASTGAADMEFRSISFANATAPSTNTAPEFDDADDIIALTLNEDAGATTITDGGSGIAVTDTDVGDTLTWTQGATTPTKGTTSFIGTKSATGNAGDLPTTYTYTPAANANGADVFTVNVSDGNGGTDTLTVNVTLTDIADISSDGIPGNGSYKAGDNLDFSVTFDESVTVTGTPRIALDIGGSTKYASFLTGNTNATSGTVLTFRYTIEASLNDTNGITVANTIDLNTGTIIDTDTDGSGADLSNLSFASTAAVLVDTTAPTTTVATKVFSADTGTSATDFITKTAAQTISGTLSTVTATGEIVEVSLDNGSTWSTATNTTGQNTWTIAKTLTASNTLQVRVTDAAGNNGAAISQAYVLDTTPPTTTVATKVFSADTGTSATDFITKTAAQTISGTLSTVTATGEIVEVSLDNGSTWSTATNTTGQNTWTIAKTLTASNTLQVRVTDAAGNNGAAISQAYVLDSASPTVSSVAVPANATYGSGQHLDFTVNTSHVVTVTNTPRLTLTIGATTKYANFVSGSNSSALLFRYTVEAGLQDTDGIVIAGSIDLNTSGTIQDTAGNDINNTLNSVAATTAVLVDSLNIAPVIAGTSASQAVNDNATISPFATVTITDTESDNVTTTVTLDTNTKGIFTPASLTASGFTGTGPYTLASTTPLLAQTAIRKLVFDPTDNQVAVGSPETTTFTIGVSDGVLINNSATTVISTSINDAPTISSLPTDVTVIEETLTTIDLSVATIADVDIADTDFTFTLTASAGTLSATSTASVTVIGSGTTTLELTGSMADINSFLNTIQYTGANAASGDNAATLTVTLNDEDGSGDVAGGSVNVDITELFETINVTVTDNTTAESVTPLISIGPNQGNFNVVLTSKPIANVTLSLLSSDNSEGVVTSPANKTLTFTPANWNQVQSVTATGVNDDIQDGNISYNINLTASSSDTEYQGKTAQATLINSDDDTAGLMVTTTDATTDESGATATFTVVLKSEPSTDVTVTLASANSAEGGVTSPATKTLSFNAANWDTAQPVSVTGVDDNSVDGTVNYTVNISSSSVDANYNNLSDSVSLSNADNDSAGLSVSTPASTSTSESGSSISYSLALNSMPAAPVTIALSSNDATEGSVSPAAITINPLDWDSPQTITVSGVDDSDLDGSKNYTITLVSTSTDTDYNGLTDTKNFSNADNESDLDFDGIEDNLDNCPNIANPGQDDFDNDGIGDLCDAVDNSTPPSTPIEDADNDTIADSRDNCVNDYNPNQSDVDGDGVGDVCDTTSVTIDTPPTIDVPGTFTVTPNQPGGGGGTTQTGTTPVTLSVSTVSKTNPTDGTIPVVSTTTTLTITPATTPPEPEAGEPVPPAGSMAPVKITATNSDVLENGYAITVAFTIEEGSDAVFSGYWKYGKEAIGDTAHWYDLGTLAANASIPNRKGTGYSLSADAKTITVTLIDGLRGDDDLLANGNIDDPGAPILALAAAVIAQPIPFLGPLGSILLASLIGLIARRRIIK
jgi:uncharacterized protein DUF4347/Big-like domain-containing protein